MPHRIEQPGPTVQQVSGNAPGLVAILSVLAKRTYQVERDGRLTPADEQLPLAELPADVPDGSDRLATDTDLFPLKPATDLVVLGHAYGRGRSQFDVTVGVNGKTVKRIRVFGDREVGALTDGNILIAPPVPIEKVPLAYSHAYGGSDKNALANHGNPWAALAGYYNPNSDEAGALNPFRYPRNPAGRGYLLEPTVAAVNALVMPNLEDPLDLLTQKRLAFREPGWWHKQPLPQATEWLPHMWFPRVGFLGVSYGAFGKVETLAEVERGFVPPEIMDERMPTEHDAYRFTCGASLGLQLPHFRGGEIITLDNAHSTDSRFTVRLPSARPKIWTDGRKGTLKETEPVIQTVVVEPDAGRVSVVWCGSAPALRHYLPQELEKMPLRVEWE